MPASIKANPKTVVISIWSFSHKAPTTIEWDTGSNAINGTVWVTDDTNGKRPRKAGDTHDKPFADNQRKGKATTLVSLGMTSIFELKPTDNDKIVLAVVVVEGREELGLPLGVIGQQRFPLLQGITNLRVIPGVDWVRILFRTRQPTNPIIDIKDATTNELASGGVILGRLSQRHDYTFQLAQSTFYNFHIVAYSTGIVASSGGKPVEEAGLFRTGSRHAQVFFDQVIMHTDGDAGWLGDGEFTFDMGAGDIDSGDMLGATQFVDDISGGEFRTFNKSVAIAPAPVGLWVQVRAYEDDSLFIAPFGHPPFVEFAPEGSTWTALSNSEVATVTKWFDLSDAGPVPQEIPFKLETGPRHIDFTFNCRLRMEATPGVVLQPRVTKSAKPIMRARTVAIMVSGERVALAGRETRVVQLGRDGHLYRANRPDRVRAKAQGRDRDVLWTSLAGGLREPLMVATAGEDLHLLALGESGEVLHRVLSPDDVEVRDRDESWCSLGGSFVWPVAVALTPENVDLFALSLEGEVFHKSLYNRAECGWKKIGEGMVVGSLNAFVTQCGEIGIVAVGHNGEIQHLSWPPESVSDAYPKWQSLGAAPRGALSAEVFDDVVVFAVVAEDETLSAAPWRNYPQEPQPYKLEWRPLGTMNALISARYSLLPATRAAPEADSLEVSPVG